MTKFIVKNNAESTVADNPLAQSATTLNVSIGEGTNFPSTFPFMITIWDDVTYPDPGDDSGMEIVKCTFRSNDSLTIVRAQEDTSDVAHSQGERVAMLITAGIIDELITEVVEDTAPKLGGDLDPNGHGFSIGSDADGDLYYRASGALARLEKGTSTQVLSMNSGATAPEWADNDPLIAKSIADIATDINSANTDSIPASYFNNVFSEDDSASIFNNTNLTATKAETIVKNSNLSSDVRTDICVLKTRVFGFWVSGGSLGTVRRYLAGCGTQSAGLCMGGYTGSNSAVTEEYDGSAWSAGGSLGTERYGLAGCGTQSAGLCMGGNYISYSAVTEEYDGSAWSTGGSLGTARSYLTGCGTQSAGLCMGGYTGSNSAVTEEYDGSAWSAGGSLGTARYALAGCGTQSAGLCMGGYTGSNSAVTEEYW